MESKFILLIRIYDLVIIQFWIKIITYHHEREFYLRHSFSLYLGYKYQTK